MGCVHPDTVIVDCGIWGRRGRTGTNESDGANVYDYTVPSFTEEVNDFASRVHTHFVDSLVVWIYGFCEPRIDNFDTSSWVYDIQKSIVDAVKTSRLLGRSVYSDLLVNKSKIAGFAEHENLRGRSWTSGRCYDLSTCAQCAHGGHGPALRILAKIINMAIDQCERGQ